MFNRINNRLDTAEQMIIEPKAIAIETHQNEITKDERLKNHEQCITELWNIFKRPDIHVIDVPEEEGRREYKGIF